MMIKEQFQEHISCWIMLLMQIHIKNIFWNFQVYCAILLIFDARDFNTDIIYPEDVLGIPNLDLSKRFFMEKSKISASNVYSSRRR